MSYSGAIVRGMASPPVKTRRSRAELRELVLDAAVDLIYQDGLELRPSAISYSKVFAHLEATRGVRVTRASVHERIWSSQAEFQDEVLQRAVKWDSTTTRDMLRETVNDFVRSSRLEDPSVAEDALREIVRGIGPAFMTSSEYQDQWSSWMATALASATQKENTALREWAELAVSETYDEQTSLFRDVAGQIFQHARRETDESAIGREDLLGLLAMVSIALADGIELRRRLEDALPPVHAPTGPAGVSQEWDLYGFVMWTLVRAWTRPMEEAPAEG